MHIVLMISCSMKTSCKLAINAGPVTLLKLYKYIYLVLITAECIVPFFGEHGTVIHRGVGVGDTAAYQCNGGYSLIGTASRRCLSTGKWSGHNPTCMRKYNYNRKTIH